MSVDRTTVRERVEAIKEIPTLSGVVKKISMLVEDENISIPELSREISKDQVIAAKVLKLINSGFYGFPGRINTIKQAIVLLGFDVVKGLILSASVFDMMVKDMFSLLEHSLGCAIVAGCLARKLSLPEPEEISVAGLLHDLGKVIIFSEFKEETTRISQLLIMSTMLQHEAERKVLGVDHARIAGWLVSEWNLHKNIVEPLIYHHRPDIPMEKPVQTGVIHVADILIKAQGFGSDGDRFVPPVSQNVWKLLELNKTIIKEVVEESIKEIDNIDTSDFII